MLTNRGVGSRGREQGRKRAEGAEGEVKIQNLPLASCLSPFTNYPLPITHYQLPTTHYQFS
ncbi:hypothetical protein H6G17_18760 [Chroococcidiopsis sp. FACHB-1243]|uniref:hypothetical protein n=1 Tax=Chroococcidiopsis sp. [FACHB-1243] TaxID=2692781 RepID=UPI00177FDB06|nr:hypothetical protein [Chroococcidiopsis sp. [FACHB-1243]]MBD2307518.1 hypothetical protein [Chroococcidiopsis sp. [FACHB-1243]]